MIVESPAKAKTIAKYLGDMYKVVASYGHIRDLAAKDGSVLPEKGFEMKWSMTNTAQSRLDGMSEILKE